MRKGTVVIDCLFGLPWAAVLLHKKGKGCKGAEGGGGGGFAVCYCLLCMYVLLHMASCHAEVQMPVWCSMHGGACNLILILFKLQHQRQARSASSATMARGHTFGLRL